ncbi:Stage II sporulation P family protein [Thermosinus carboxydivorans Nor1]|uniref:Stage II sporulation P family protein n=1 Tax=Thermosinus carboxydivorans Nor1 TaxID=401526 RepID=A1HTI8_9FIRM|nr:stage II sporulation protein P [Thermosinus carboxydivorans]EAX46665.1 Stage II sporulation P family protein [Thermosinus carboxydivorans Nor1]
MRCIYVFVLLLLSMATALPPGRAAGSPYDTAELVSGYMTIVDEKGGVIFQTGLAVHPGDEFIDENDRVYEITAVEGTLAKARYVRDETYSQSEFDAIPVQAPAAPAQPPLIAIYHTHTDESYIPSDGKATEPGNGGVMLVGDSLAKRLEELGFATDHNKTLHEPHDANAYQRSRRTVMKLLERKPVALFDIHRDSAPQNIYNTTIAGAPATKILLVVGRQNQNRETTMAFARQIKAAADAKYSGLIRGIFIAHGNYNQDLSPRAMLIEIGTQYNSRDAAERSAALFADIVPAILNGNQQAVGVAPAAPDGAGPAHYVQPTASIGRDILVIAGALIAGAGAFLFLSTGSWQEAKSKLAQFKAREFQDLLWFRRKRKR